MAPFLLANFLATLYFVFYLQGGLRPPYRYGTKYNVQLQPESWSKENYLRYGTIYGKKYCTNTDYGEWDKNFTLEILDKFVEEFYKKLKN